MDIVEFAIKELIPAKNDRSSDTAKLLAENPNAAAVIDHLVERRGFYFHGNIKRKDAWKANEQGSAESLALLAIGIASQIAIKAAGLLFSPEYERRHFEDAMHAGAEIVFQVNFKFRDPGENFDRERQIEIAMPGTKPTPRTAFDVAQQCLKIFQHTQPASALLSMECTMIGTGQKVFELVFSVCDDLRGAG